MEDCTSCTYTTLQGATNERMYTQGEIRANELVLRYRCPRPDSRLTRKACFLLKVHINVPGQLDSGQLISNSHLAHPSSLTNVANERHKAVACPIRNCFLEI